jgi:hypothetical protein
MPVIERVDLPCDMFVALELFLAAATYGAARAWR